MALRERRLIQLSREVTQLGFGQVGEDAKPSESAHEIAGHHHDQKLQEEQPPG
jgi:hypothetical protein